MANFLDKLKINTAVTDRTKLDLTSDHISTANFMQFNVAWSKELVPGEKIEMNMETFTRLAPMPVPTFGRARINNRAFFVPFRTIFPGWNDFITDTRHSFATGTAYTINFVPRINANRIYKILNDELLGVTTPDTEVSVSYVDMEDNDLVLTAKGRQYVKILQSLGYNWLWTSTDDLSLAAMEDVYVSALPLLATAKVYYDWYYPSAYVQDAIAEEVAAIFNRDDEVDYVLSDVDVANLLRFLGSVNYDSDYFVASWENPVGPNGGSFSGAQLPDITFENSLRQPHVTVDPDSNGTPSLNLFSSLTQYGIDALKSLTDYMKRHQLVGARALDRYLSRFGIQLSAEKLKRSVYIGTTSDDIQFGDVTATADTAGAPLGDYAGKGIGYGSSGFEFETDEYGIMIVVSTILPKTGYYQGIDRNTMHCGRLDYWTPEFDNLGTQAIAKGELYMPTSYNALVNETDFATPRALNEGVFGWTPRYAEYKIGRDRLTGDFRYGQINTGMDSWHTMRQVGYDNVDDIVQNQYFVTGSDADQYSRIFYNTNAESADKFNVIYHFNVVSYSPMKALWDTYEFEDKGRQVTMNANGVKMN